MAKTPKVLENIPLTNDEMDLIFAGLEGLQSDAAKILKASTDIKAGDTAHEADKFHGRLEDLKQKFLHE